MDVDSIVKLAFRYASCSAKGQNAEMPDIHDLTVPEWLLWYRVRDIYSSVLSGRVDKTAGADLKGRMLYQYDLDVRSWLNAEQVSKRLSEFWKRVEGPAQLYAANPCVETADQFFAAVYNCSRKVGEDAAVDKLLERIEAD